MTTYILRLPQVKTQTGIGRTSIYNAVNAGTFPAPVKLGARAVGWHASDIAEWIAARPSASGAVDRGAPTPDAPPAETRTQSPADLTGCQASHQLADELGVHAGRSPFTCDEMSTGKAIRKQRYKTQVQSPAATAKGTV